MRTVLAYGGFVILSLMWGMSFVAIRIVDSELSPINYAALRWLTASPLFLLFFPLIGRPSTGLERRDIPRLIGVAVMMVPAYTFLLGSAEKLIPAGLAGLLISLAPIFALVLSVLLVGERANFKVLVALLLAIVGSLFVSIGSVRLTDLSSFLGIGEMVFAALIYGSFGVLSKPLVDKYGSSPVTILTGLLGTAILIPVIPSTLTIAVSLSTHVWIAILYLSIISTVVGNSLFFALMSRGAVSRLYIQLYLVPVVSVVGGALLLAEPVSIWMIIGGTMLLFAVSFATWK